MLALPQHKSICEGRPARRDMNKLTTRKIQRRKLIQPSVQIPRPARDGAVDDRCLEEAKSKVRNDWATFERAPDHHADAEQRLVEAGDDVRDVGKSTEIAEPTLVIPELARLLMKGPAVRE
jgi:hypothetical protein